MISVRFGAAVRAGQAARLRAARRRARRRRTRRSGRPRRSATRRASSRSSRPQQFRLYQLIWQRFIASQMAPAILDGTTVDIDAGPRRGERAARSRRTASGRPARWSGSPASWPSTTAGRDDGDDGRARRGRAAAAGPRARSSTCCGCCRSSTSPSRRRATPRRRWSRRWRSRGSAGRAPTRRRSRRSRPAPTSTIEEKKLVPTELGMVVNDLLVEHFPTIFDIGFTSQLEEELDEIAAGRARLGADAARVLRPVHRDAGAGRADDGAGAAEGRAVGRDLREVRPADGDQARPVRQVPGLQRLPGVPQLEAACSSRSASTCPTVPAGRDRRAAVARRGGPSTGAAATRSATSSAWNKPVDASPARAAAPTWSRPGARGKSAARSAVTTAGRCRRPGSCRRQRCGVTLD